jgi:hypothetical protein
LTRPQYQARPDYRPGRVWVRKYEGAVCGASAMAQARPLSGTLGGDSGVPVEGMARSERLSPPWLNRSLLEEGQLVRYLFEEPTLGSLSREICPS